VACSMLLLMSFSFVVCRWRRRRRNLWRISKLSSSS
jgi:hypothetical protein